jgi:hypothetical protein
MIPEPVPFVILSQGALAFLFLKTWRSVSHEEANHEEANYDQHHVLLLFAGLGGGGLDADHFMAI